MIKPKIMCFLDNFFEREYIERQPTIKDKTKAIKKLAKTTGRRRAITWIMAKYMGIKIPTGIEKRRRKMATEQDLQNPVRNTMIKTIIRLQNDMVMVFDAEGEQIPRYQGQYEDVRGNILRDALPEAVFAHWFDYDDEPETIPKKDW